MKPNLKVSLVRFAAVALGFVVTAARAQDPLPSWNDGGAKQAIVDFVKATTETGGAKFVAHEERIATFDQDGTLWVEHPMYTHFSMPPATRTAFVELESATRAVSHQSYGTKVS